MPREYRTSLSSRERNRMHARKTRQRKKEQVQHLQNRANELKDEQLRLRQIINEKNTASILVGLFATSDKKENGGAEDPRVEELLRRSVDEIPDASKVPELPALILPGQHSSKKGKGAASSIEAVEATQAQHDTPDDGIDYDLLGKDRAKCSAAELDQIRRERNRMHAKRTRDRKRLFMEEMEEIIKKLEEENSLLQLHLDYLNGDQGSSEDGTPMLASPSLQASDPSLSDQITSLLLAAGSFEKKNNNQSGITERTSTASAVSASSNASEHSSVADEDDARSLSPLPKRQRLDHSSGSSGSVRSGLPMSITTSNMGTAVGY